MEKWEMQLELGKFYKSRKGDKRGPLVESTNLNDGSVFSDGYWTYRTDGTWAGPQMPERDLIEEWRDEPKSPIEEKMVLCRRIHYGEYGNLTIYESKGDLRIEFNKSKHTAEELEEASHILAQLAEFLRSEEK